MKAIVLGTVAFALVWTLLGTALQAALRPMGLQSPFADFVAMYLLALPVALAAGRRAGRPTHLAVLLACIALALILFGAIVWITDAVARPVGRSVAWAALFSPWNWQGTVVTLAAMLGMPQLWLWLLDRLAADPSGAGA